MNKKDSWNIFLKSGSVADYLTYLNSKENSDRDTIANEIYRRGNSNKRDECGRE